MWHMVSAPPPTLPPAAITNPPCIHVAVHHGCIMAASCSPTMWWADESQRSLHLPSILSRLAALATSSRLLRDFSSGSAIFLLNPDPLPLSFLLLTLLILASLPLLLS